MIGYHGMAAATSETIRDGWIYTGDLARVEGQGYFTIADRAKDMIISGAENIYPKEIEEVLFTHPKVAQAAVIGVPHPRSGESVKAFIQLKPGVKATPEEIIEFTKDKLAGYKRPREVEFRDDLPTSIIGKVLRRVLRDEELKKRQ